MPSRVISMNACGWLRKPDQGRREANRSPAKPRGAPRLALRPAQLQGQSPEAPDLGLRPGRLAEPRPVC
jgi:hypothetical protein